MSCYREPEDLVLVLETRSAAELMVAKSILDDAEIPYLERGDALQDLASLGRVLFGMPRNEGHLTLHVPPEHAETARELLQVAPP